MSVVISYKKQILFFIFLILIVLVTVEGILRINDFLYLQCTVLTMEEYEHLSFLDAITICNESQKIRYDTSGTIPLLILHEGKFFNVNSDGFRGNELSKEDKYRIIFLGGSTMLGSAVAPNNETIPGFFEEKSKNDFNNIEIINGGISGADSTNEWYYLKNYLQKHEPDMIVMYDGWNNVMNRNDPKADIPLEMLSSYKYHNLKTTESDFIREFKDLVIKSDIHILKHIGLFLMEQKIINNESRLVVESEFNEDVKKVHSILNRDWNKVCELGIERDFIPVFFIQPILGTSERAIHVSEERYLDDEVRKKELEIIKKISLDKIDISNCPNVYDLRNAFNQYDNKMFFGDAGHTNSAGNKIIAEKMYEEMKNILIEDTK